MKHEKELQESKKAGKPLLFKSASKLYSEAQKKLKKAGLAAAFIGELTSKAGKDAISAGVETTKNLAGGISGAAKLGLSETASFGKAGFSAGLGSISKVFSGSHSRGNSGADNV